MITHVSSSCRGGYAVLNFSFSRPLNFSYAKPKFSLAKISNEVERIAEFDELWKCDKEKCFYWLGDGKFYFRVRSCHACLNRSSFHLLSHQFSLSTANRKTLRFKIKLKVKTLYFQWNVMAMGMSAAPYVAQSTNNFLCQVYSMKFGVYCCVYLDDVWGNKKSGVPKFEDWAGEFGLKFKTSKSEEGPVLELLGVEVNLVAKTARITKDKAETISKDADLLLRTGVASSKQLATFYGRLEFAASMCPLGRTQTRALTKNMGSIQLATQNGLSDKDEIWLDLESLEEIRFWGKIANHDPLKIGKRALSCGNVTLASDASQTKFAYVIGDKSYADTYPTFIKNEHISVKESFALSSLIKKACKQDTDYEILCDNVTTVSCFNKGRSNNRLIHDLVKESWELLAELNSRLRVVWIPTSRMEDYADGPSRGVYKRAEYGLTSEGIDRIIDLFPSFEARRRKRDLVSLFAGPLNNPAKVRYFALDIDATDPLSAGMDAFQIINKKKQEGGRLAGGMLAYPPVALINTFNRLVREVGLEEDSELYYIIPSSYVGKTLNAMFGVGEINVSMLCGKSNSRILYKKPQTLSMAILNIRSRDLAESQSKRPRLCH